MNTSKFVTVVASVLVVIAMCSSSARADLVHDMQGPYPLQAHIDYAAPFSFVGATYLNSVSGYQIPASGVLIAPNKVLTAAHNLFDYELAPAQSMQFAVGADVLGNPEQVVNVSSWVIHPDYTGIGGRADLAVLTLAEPVTVTDPVSIFMGDYVLGTEVAMVGYGRPGTVGQGYQSEFDGLRRAGVLIPSEYGGGVWAQDYLSAWFFQVGWPYSHELGQMATPGDSGGGWFVDNNGHWELVGITAINNGFYGYGGRSGATALDDRFGYRDWVMTVPEPAAIVLFGVGALGAFSRRRRC